ncbi:Ldh family oxidoreductase [Embleya sp. AB8]|uniref:Ldh family oxidoreductase n=1 Tax=Embleya sp. AB8 TaxID=3156304 RepID=UPI003C77DB6D
MSTETRRPAADADAIRVAPGELTLFVDSICRRLGAPGQVAAEVAEHLIEANLAGHDAHGVARLAHYVAESERGELVPAARPQVLRRGGASVLLDARRGFGPYAARTASELVASAAIRHGVGVATIRHCGGLGRLGHYCELLAHAGLVGLLTVGAAGRHAAAASAVESARGGRGTRVGRFPAADAWALGVPGTAHPVLVDMSTASLAEPGSRAASPEDGPGWSGDGAEFPALQRGFGLAVGAALLGGLAAIGDGAREVGGVCLIAIDPDAFGGLEPYRAMVAETILLLAGADPDGAGGPLPGAAEHRSRQARAAGIPLPRSVVADLIAVGARFDVPTRLPRPWDAATEGSPQSVAARGAEEASSRP